MDKNQILIGVDECTFVMSADKASIENIEDWQKKAENMFAEFARLASMERIFGKQKNLKAKCLQGYSTA